MPGEINREEMEIKVADEIIATWKEACAKLYREGKIRCHVPPTRDQVIGGGDAWLKGLIWDALIDARLTGERNGGKDV